MRADPSIVFAVALVACSTGNQSRDTWLGKGKGFSTSPDGKYVVLFSSVGAFSFDVDRGRNSTAVEGPLDGEAPFGGFSPDGSLFLTRTAVGKIAVTTTAAGGNTVELTDAIDMGKVSPDGALVAFLRNERRCSVVTWLFCADLLVVSARGGTAALVGSALALTSDSSGNVQPISAHLDEYYFAGPKLIVYGNERGEVWSVTADGATATKIAGPVGAFPSGAPRAPFWSVSPDESVVVYNDAGGVEAQPLGGGTARRLLADPAGRVPCMASDRNIYARELSCAFSADSKFAAIAGASGSLTVVALDGTRATSVSTRASNVLAFLPDNRVLFVEADGTLVAASPSGAKSVLPGGPREFPSAAVSPDGAWAAFWAPNPTLTCTNCETIRLVSTSGSGSWTPSAAGAPIPVEWWQFSPDSSRLLVVRSTSLVTQGAWRGDLEMIPLMHEEEARLLASEVNGAQWVGPNHVLYRRETGDIYLATVP